MLHRTAPAQGSSGRLQHQSQNQHSGIAQPFRRAACIGSSQAGQRQRCTAECNIPLHKAYPWGCPAAAPAWPPCSGIAATSCHHCQQSAPAPPGNLPAGGSDPSSLCAVPPGTAAPLTPPHTGPAVQGSTRCSWQFAGMHQYASAQAAPQRKKAVARATAGHAHRKGQGCRGCLPVALECLQGRADVGDTLVSGLNLKIHNCLLKVACMSPKRPAGQWVWLLADTHGGRLARLQAGMLAGLQTGRHAGRTADRRAGGQDCRQAGMLAGLQTGRQAGWQDCGQAGLQAGGQSCCLTAT